MSEPRDDRMTPVHLMVLALLSLAMADAYLTRVPGAFLGPIQETLHLTNTQVGDAVNGFELGYLALQIPGGWLGLKLGNRRALPLMCLGWSTFTLCFALAETPRQIWLARLGIGVFQAGLIPCSAMAVAEWFSQSRRGVASGIVTSCMQLGAVMALKLTSSILARTGDASWRWVLLGYASAGLVWSAAFWLLFRDRPSEHPWLSAAGSNREAPDVPRAPRPALADLLSLLACASLWFLCCQMVFRAYGYVLFPNWFPTFLKKGWKVDPDSASSLTLLPILAVAAGGLFGGSLIDVLYRRTGSKYVSRSGTAVVSMVLCSLFTFLAIYAPDVQMAVASVTAAAFFAGIGGPITWAAVIDVFGRKVAMLVGLVNMCGNFGAWLCNLSMGRVFDFLEKSGGDWDLVFRLFSGVYLIAAVCWLFVRPECRDRPAAQNPS